MNLLPFHQRNSKTVDKLLIKEKFIAYNKDDKLFLIEDLITKVHRVEFIPYYGYKDTLDEIILCTTMDEEKAKRAFDDFKNYMQKYQTEGDTE